MLASQDKQEIRIMIREEVRDAMREEMQGLIRKEMRDIVREEIHQEADRQFQRLELLHENFEQDVRGMLGDIIGLLQDTLGLRPRVEVLEVDVAVLKRPFLVGATKAT